MDGRRGLVPSNFVERVSDDDLVTFLPSELNDLTHSSYQEKSFISASTSSGDKSDLSVEESSISPLTSRAEGDQEEPVSHTAVPYPRKLTLIKQLARSIVVGWEPPLVPAGCPDVQSYNIYVDEELRQNVKSGFQTKAVIEKLDLKSKAYRVSVQSVTEQGSSDKLRCTFFVGQDFGVAPTMLKVRSVTATSAEVTWLPCNSNYNHAVYLNGEECDITKPGVYWYTFRNLQPSTAYVAKLEARPLQSPWEEPPEGQEQSSAVIHFTTPLAGTGAVMPFPAVHGGLGAATLSLLCYEALGQREARFFRSQSLRCCPVLSWCCPSFILKIYYLFCFHLLWEDMPFADFYSMPLRAWKIWFAMTLL